MMPQGTDDSLRVDLVQQQPHAPRHHRGMQFTGRTAHFLSRIISLNNFKFAGRDASDRPHTLGEGGSSGFPAMADMSDISDDLDDILGSGLQLMRPAALQADKPGTHISRNLFQGNQVLPSEGEKQESNSPSMASSAHYALSAPSYPLVQIYAAVLHALCGGVVCVPDLAQICISVRSTMSRYFSSPSSAPNTPLRRCCDLLDQRDGGAGCLARLPSTPALPA
jgi:hypothetical protein